MPILILSRTRPSLRWERISVSHSIATAASPTAANDVGSWTVSRRSTASAVMSDLGRILLQKSFSADGRNFLGPQMRLAFGDVGDRILSHKSDHELSYRSPKALQQ